MSSDSNRPQLPEDLRDLLREMGQETPPGEREFAARLHRSLAAAGQPPTSGWLERLGGGLGEQKRSLLTGAVLGALATATAFLLLSNGRPLRDGNPAASPEDEMADVDTPSLGPGDRKAQRAVGDRRITRDRLGEDIGAERPERARAHDAPLPRPPR
jgi:hypothetical protein